MLTKRTLLGVDALLAHQRDRHVMEQRPRRSRAEGAAFEVFQPADLRPLRVDHVVDQEPGRRDQLDLGALLDRRQHLGKAGDHHDVAAAADDGAHQLGAVADADDVGLEAELLEEALLLHDLLERRAGGRRGADDVDGLALRQRRADGGQAGHAAEAGGAEFQEIAARERGRHGGETPPAQALPGAGTRLLRRL